MIEIKNISKSFGKNKTLFQALADINFSVPTGSSVAIVGKSGSGKSTLMHAISGLDRPQTGEVIIDGQNILTLKRKQIDAFRAEKIGFVFQSFFVQGRESCEVNVSLPLEISKTPISQRKVKIKKALESVELLDKAKEKAQNLSGGQKQRLAIARAIVNQPTILFADEPTGNLDSATGQKIEDLLFDYNQTHGATLFIVTHDEELADRCGIKIYLKDGQIEKIINNQEVN